MKNKLKILLRARLRSIGMEANEVHMTRLLNHVVEKLKIEDYIKKISPEEVFNATRPSDKPEKP